MSVWLFLSLTANVVFIFWLAQQKSEIDSFKWSANFWYEKAGEWQKKYIHERDNKDW